MDRSRSESYSHGKMATSLGCEDVGGPNLSVVAGAGSRESSSSDNSEKWLLSRISLSLKQIDKSDIPPTAWHLCRLRPALLVTVCLEGLRMAIAKPAVIFALWGLFHHASAFVPMEPAPPPDHPTNAHLRNLSLRSLSSQDLFFSDLTLLKISNATIEKVDKHAFDHLKHLNRLEISDSDIAEEMDPDTFSRLPGLEILVLSNIGMRGVHLNLTHVQQLTLSRNKIESLDGESIVGKDLSYLDVSGNGLRALGGSLKNLSKLSLIDISKNSIAEVGDVFEENVNLVRILASENRIATTRGLALPWVKSLDLFSNRIPALNSESFRKMAALEELVLAFNNIVHVGDAFRDLLELRSLNLAWNRIEELQPHLFRNNLYLTELSLQGNKLRSLQRFQSVHHHLTRLDLSHNQLDLLDRDLFASMPALRMLDLSFNRLKTLTDALAPLPRLQTLDLAYNQLSFAGHELSENRELLRLNLSSNALQGGATHFKHNRLLRDLDVSDNGILDFCDGGAAMKTLAKLDLRGNRIRGLECLRNWGALCEVDVRNNPLICGEALDSAIEGLARRGRSPHRSGAQPDDAEECENLSPNRSLALWNVVKRELCPSGRDLEAESLSGSPQWDTSEESGEAGSSESEEVGRNDSQRKQFLVVPIGWIGRDELNKPNPLESPQSERMSWERIDGNAELLKDLEEEEEELGRRGRFSWYSIALILIGLSLTLTCFNLVVFFYIKMRVWKRGDGTSPQKYTVLRNEVYKNTTEPTKVLSSADGEYFLQSHIPNRIFSSGKLSFGFHSKGKDNESAKNVLITPADSNGALNC